MRRDGGRGGTDWSRLNEARGRSARMSLAHGQGVDEAIGACAPDAVGARDVLGVGRQIRIAVGGAGPAIEPLLEDHAVTDVLVNGSKGVWVDRGSGLVRESIASELLEDESEIRALAVRLAAACGQRLDDSSPIVDGTFPSGLRLHAVLPPLSAEGTLISLRVHRAVSFSLDELGNAGMCDCRTLILLRKMIEKRANVLVSGATGSGKTTLLSALLGEVPVNERILVIEESAELKPAHPHVVHLQIRRANVQGRGEVVMSDLVRAAMRMRPDRIVLGECRGAEVREVLSALNTGHEGGWATIHANSAEDVPSRLVALGALAGMSEGAVAAQVASALDAVVHVERVNGCRSIASIGVFERRGGELRCREALVPGESWRRGGWELLAKRLALPNSWGGE